MKRFIEATPRATGRKIFVNVQHIVELAIDQNGTAHIVLSRGDRSIPVKESYDELKRMIEEGEKTE